VPVDNLPTYIPLDEAAATYRLDRDVLTRAVENDIIRAVKTTRGGILVAEEDVSELPDIPFPTDEMKGRAIRATEALKKYKITSHSTLAGWRERGIVTVIKQNHKNVTYDEYTIALAAQVYHTAKKRQGIRYPRVTTSH